MRRCPFQAHIRKANPRGDLTNGRPNDEDELERRHRIVRRGVPYGAPGTAPVGLLFGCYQADISQQFAFIQTRWLNDRGFAVGGTGRDPLAASGDNSANLQRWIAERGGTSKPAHFDFGNFVRMRGGEFFFVPSKPFLKKLKP